MKIRIISIGLFFLSATASAVCLNPFGCEPRSEQECINDVARSVRTEHAAKVQINECREKFSVSEALCFQDSKLFKAAVAAGSNAKMVEARKALPTLSEFDDQVFVRVVHEVYYPNLDIAEVAKQLGVVLAPHRATCRKFYGKFYP